MSQIKQQVRDFIQTNFILGNQGPSYSDSDSLLALHIVDSMGFLELITFLEETWGIRIAEEEMLPENLDSLDAIEAFVQRKQAA
jgi:acyl carrier protein